MAGITKYADLLNEAQGVAPLCPPNELIFQFRRAFQEFCRVSQAWREWLEFIETVNQQDYPLAPLLEFEADVIDIADFRMKAANSTNSFDFGYPQHPSTWRFNRVADNPIVTTAWTPSATGERILRVLAVLVPSNDAREIDDQDFFARWWRGVLAKALYETLKMDGKPWYNPTEAETRRREYWNIVGDAKREASLALIGANGNDGMTG